MDGILPTYSFSAVRILGIATTFNHLHHFWATALRILVPASSQIVLIAEARNIRRSRRADVKIKASGIDATEIQISFINDPKNPFQNRLTFLNC